MELAAWVLRVKGFVVGGILQRVLLVGCLACGGWCGARGGVEWGAMPRGGVARDVSEGV